MLFSQKTTNLKSFNISKNNKKDLNNDIFKKCQIKYNSFLKEHKYVTMSGTKRYEDKSGQYYLQNSVKFQRNNLTLLNQKSNAKKNLTNFQNNKNIIKVNKSKLFDELVPIPKMKQKNKLKCDYEKKNLNNAVNNAKYIRRYQYSKNLTQKKIQQHEEIQNKEKIFLSKIKLIQIWWKTIFQIIKIQKNIKGFLYRKIFITILAKRKKYFEAVLNIIRTIKNIYWKKLLQNIMLNKPGIKNYFNKWINITFKNIIVKRMIKHINMKIINDNNNNNDLENQNLTSRSCKELNKQNNQILLTKKLKNNNQSLLDLHEYQTFNKNSSTTSLSLRIKKNRLSLGLDISSYKFFNPKNSNNIEVKQTRGIDNKLNKNNEKTREEKKALNNSSINKNYNENKSIKFSKRENNNIKDTKTIKSTLSSNQKINKKNNKDNRDNNNKKKIKKKKKINKIFNTNMIINNNYLNKLKDTNKFNKNKVYENELNLYNNKFQTLEINSNNNENNFLNMKKEWIDYSEINLDESQFNSLLDNSTMKDNQIININYNDNKLNKVDSNLIYVEINNDNIEKNNILKIYFKKWIKICVLKKIITNKRINEGINILSNIIDKQMYKIFFYKLEMINKIKLKEIFIDFIDNSKKKIFIKDMKLFRNKYCLCKYFNILKYKIQKKLIIEKIIQYQKDKIKKNNEEKNIRQEYPNYYYINDQYITNLPISNDFINDKFNLNPNQTNHCFIINNLNYNNNTNNIDIKLSYDDINNKTDNINNINISKIKSKIISFPKKKNKQNKPYIGLYKRNNNILQNIDNNFTDNAKQIFIKKNCNSSNLNNIKKEKNNNSISINSFCNEINLNKSVALSKYQNQLNWDLMTKKNQLIMVINILERHRKIKTSKIYNYYFKIWKNKINNNCNYSKILKNEDIYKSNIYEKKINLKRGVVKDEKSNKNDILYLFFSRFIRK